MKSGIHPAYRKVLFVDGATGDEWVSYSTMTGTDTRTHAGEALPMIRLEISAISQPLWTGNARQCATDVDPRRALMESVNRILPIAPALEALLAQRGLDVDLAERLQPHRAPTAHCGGVGKSL